MNIVSADQPATFNFLPWREWHQAERRRRRRLLWIAGCAVALLPGVWLQIHYRAEHQSKLLAYTQSQASNYIHAMQLEELALRQGAIEDWLAAAMLDRQTALRWSALANLLRAERRIVHELRMNDGQLSLYGQSADVSDLRSLESNGDRLFAGEYALREVRRQHGLFHFQMDVAWTGAGPLLSSPSPTGGVSP